MEDPHLEEAKAAVEVKEEVVAPQKAVVVKEAVFSESRVTVQLLEDHSHTLRLRDKSILEVLQQDSSLLKCQEAKSELDLRSY